MILLTWILILAVIESAVSRIPSKIEATRHSRTRRTINQNTFEANYIIDRLEIRDLILQPTDVLVIPGTNEEKSKVQQISFESSIVFHIPRSLGNEFPNLKNLSFSMTSVPQILSTNFFETYFDKIKSFSLDGFLLNADKKIRGLKERALEKVPNILELSINHQSIFYIHEKAFRSNVYLRKIDLRYNRIINLEENIFKDLRKLEEIDVSANELTSLESNLFRDNGDLKKISFYNNRIQNLTVNQFYSLKNLVEIDFGENLLETLPEKIFSGNKRLRRVKLEYNHLRTLPGGIFGGLEDLDLINLNRNKLEILDETLLKETYSLIKFYCIGNRIQEIPEGLLGEVAHLEVLALDENQISLLPGNLFRNSRRLKHIRFYMNQIIQIDPQIFDGLHKLIELDLRHNNCTDDYFSIWGMMSYMDEIPIVYEKCGGQKFERLISEESTTIRSKAIKKDEKSKSVDTLMGRPMALQSFLKKPKTY